MEIWKYGRWSLKCIRDEDGEILSLSVKYKGREAGRHSLYVLTADRRGQIRGGTNRGNEPIVLANYGIPSVWTDTQTDTKKTATLETAFRFSKKSYASQSGDSVFSICELRPTL